MTNNDELALKLKAAAEKALPAIEKYEASEIDGDDALEMLSDFTDVIKPANILSLLAERDADKKRIDELELLRKNAFVACRRWADKFREAESKLEARAVSVKLPSLNPEMFNDDVLFGYRKAQKEAVEFCAAAGIKLEVGE